MYGRQIRVLSGGSKWVQAQPAVYILIAELRRSAEEERHE